MLRFQKHLRFQQCYGNSFHVFQEGINEDRFLLFFLPPISSGTLINVVAGKEPVQRLVQIEILKLAKKKKKNMITENHEMSHYWLTEIHALIVYSIKIYVHTAYCIFVLLSKEGKALNLTSL